MKKISYSATELAFVKANCQLTRAELTAQFNSTFTRNVSVANIAALCKRNRWLTGRTGRFDNGHVPINKGKKTGYKPPNAYPKGHRPHNAAPVGEERVTTDGYVKVKVAEPNVWEFKARLVYAQTHGQIPDGYAIIYKDGDALNCELDNLHMVSRSELSMLNQLGYKRADGKIKPTILALAKLKEIINEKQER